MPFVATKNVSGYSPMDDEPPVFETPQEAWQWHVTELDRVWDNYPDDENGACLDAHTQFHNLDQSKPGAVFAYTPGYDGEHDLGMCYYVTQTEEPVSE